MRARISVYPVLVAAVASIVASTDRAAAATPTDNTRASGSDSFVAARTCSDPVRVDSTWDIVIHTDYDAAGTATRLQFTGATRITFTDLVNGNSYAPNSSGPGTVDLATGWTWTRGGSAAVFNQDGVLVATSGRIVYDADGNIVRITGTQRPVCAALGTVDLAG
jgi:hypothetical protein